MLKPCSILFLLLAPALGDAFAVSPPCSSTLARTSREVSTDQRYEADVAFLLDSFEEQAGALLKLKGVDWNAVRKEFSQASKGVTTDQEHIELCARLIARLQDGHAGFTRVEVDMAGRGAGETFGCGLELVEVGKKLYVKRAFGSAAACGVDAGSEVVKIDGLKADKWLTAATEKLCDTKGFSTPAAARWAACTWGLVGPAGERIAFELKKPKGGAKKATLTYDKSGGQGSLVGPVVFPEGLAALGRDIAWAKLPSGHGYIWIGRVPGDLHELIDQALAGLGEVPGIVLDFRANRGGGYDRDAVHGRFVPKGQSFGGESSAGPNPYGGPVVVLADPATISAGETIVGEFAEEGRAYLIGPGPTHGASGSKVELEAPSKLFAVRFVVASNKQRFNGGRGVEGIGIPPHEVVAYDPKLLAAGVDPCIARAVELLAKPLPKSKVSFSPVAAR
ncbi:MAG: S41 family peptidase [Planctomycetota bacterium]